MTGSRYQRAIEQAAGDTPAVPDASQVYQSNPPPIPPRRNRGYEYTTAGLDIRRELTGDDWRAMLPEIQAMRSAYQLIVGDCAVYGIERGYVSGYEEIAELTGFKVSSIEVYASVCRSIPQLMRVNPLTFNHYQIIAPLPEDERAGWIQYAVENHLSTRALRAAIQQSQLPAAVGTVANNAQVDDTRPALSDENEEQEATPIPDVTIREVKKRAGVFFRCIAENRLQDMPRDDFSLLVQYVNQRWNEYKKLAK